MKSIRKISGRSRLGMTLGNRGNVPAKGRRNNYFYYILLLEPICIKALVV